MIHPCQTLLILNDCCLEQCKSGYGVWILKSLYGQKNLTEDFLYYYSSLVNAFPLDFTEELALLLAVPKPFPGATAFLFTALISWILGLRTGTIFLKQGNCHCCTVKWISGWMSEWGIIYKWHGRRCPVWGFSFTAKHDWDWGKGQWNMSGMLWQCNCWNRKAGQTLLPFLCKFEREKLVFFCTYTFFSWLGK